MRYALKLFYLGKYEGFQRQLDKKTIEGHLENALKDAGLIDDLKSAAYVSAGRTDKGVHALSQVIAISTSQKFVIPTINTFLPKNIVVWAVSIVNNEFHPRYDALSRSYRYYTLYCDEDINSMRAGAKILEGIHDFKLFSKKSSKKNTIRQIYQISIEKKEPFLVFHVMGNSFLWQMVRRIVNSLLKIGQAQWKLEDLKDLLNHTPKSNIYTTSISVNGPEALILWDIEYPFKFQSNSRSLNQIKDLMQNYLADFSLKCYYFQQFYDFFDLINFKKK